MKKSEKLCDEMELIDEQFIEEAEQAAGDCSPVRGRRIVLRRALIAAAVAAVVGATAFMIPALIKGRGTTPPAGIPIESESETDFGTEPLTDEPKQTDPRETEPTPPANTTQADPEPTNTVPVDPPAIGGSNLCTVHSVMSYHSYSQEMMALVGEDEFYEWVETAEKGPSVDGCPSPNANVYEFIKHFEISRSDLEEIYYNTSLYYDSVLNFDVLYSGDDEAVDEFYRNVDELHIIEKKRRAFWELKSEPQWSDSGEKWFDTFGNYQVTPQTSIKTVVDVYGLSREDVEALVAKEAARQDYVYDYNIDALFDGSMDGLTPMEQDALFCGITDPMTE